MAQGFASAIGSALSTIMNMGANWGGGTDAHKAADLMNHQSWLWKQNTQWYNDNILAHSYKRARESLEEAGYNPLMGIGNPLSDQGPMPNATANTSAKSFSFNKLATAQTKNINADTILKGAQTEEATSSARLKTQQEAVEYQKEQLTITENEIAKVRKQLLDKDLEWYERRALAEYEKTLMETKTMQENALSNRMQANAALNSAGAKQAEYTIGIKTPVLGFNYSGHKGDFTIKDAKGKRKIK